MADDVRKLLNYIVNEYVMRDELKNIDLDATSREPTSTIEADRREILRREADRAGDLADAFGQGLRRAYQRSQLGGNDLRLDDRKPDENRMADALIRFLVSYDLAASRSDETTPNHYVYSVAVDWDRLNAVARDAGVDLPHALAANAG